MYKTSISTAIAQAYITVRKNRLKLYENKFHYLKDGTNFEIEIFNPTSKRVLAKIWINEKLISPAGIVVNAHQRAYLERFIDVQKKFEFKTFVVDNVEETESAREKNGKIRIEFYEEKLEYPINMILYGNHTQDFNQHIPNLMYFSSDLNYSNNVSFSSTTSYSADIPKNIETGRVSEGSKSNQELHTTSGEFNDWSLHFYEYQLLPESLKVTIPNKIRSYCQDCGTKVKPNWRRCPICEASL